MRDETSDSGLEVSVKDVLQGVQAQHEEDVIIAGQSGTGENASKARNLKRRKLNNTVKANAPDGVANPLLKGNPSLALGHVITSLQSNHGTSHTANSDLGLADQSPPNNDTRLGRQSTYPYNGLQLPMSPKAQELWKRFLKKFITNFRVQRMLASYKQNSTPPCSQCASMKLTENKFIISEFSKHHRHDRVPVTTARSPPGFVVLDKLGPEGLSFGPREFRLGSLAELYMRKDDCPFCGLAATSLSDQCKSAMQDPKTKVKKDEDFYKADITCFVSWQIDGRTLIRQKADKKIIGSRPCTRRIRLHWKVGESASQIGELFDTYIVLVAPRNGGKGLFFGRALRNVKTDAALIRRWIGYCEDSHGDACKSQTQGSLLSKSFFGVIDVTEMCLTKLPPGSRYIALSYTWGEGGHHFQTTSANVRDHLKPGGLRKMEIAMPRTIKDAINLVRDLGERYLWIDSICIIQKNDRSWALNSRVMDQVYGNAHLTICAADGEGAGAGLQILNPERSQADKNSKEQSLSQNITQYNRDIRLMSTQPAENYIRKSVWNTRGWAFQERLLSPRNLIFTGGRMYFQCRCTARSADIITEDESAGWSIEFQDSPILMLQKLSTRPVSVYKQALELYMTRQLTHSKDILAAFTGIGNLVCNALGGSLVYGLPSSHFDWALLWEPRDAAVLRPNEGGERFPSWSWCGWKNTKNQIMEYKEEMLVGCEDNLHDWLMKRTWITWYIRDGNGNLRPVWGGESKTISAQAEETWKGYNIPGDFHTDTHDKFGRYVQPAERANRLAEAADFRIILDECPFGVEIVGRADYDTDARSSSTERDMPYLQFKTWSAFFRIEEDLPCKDDSDPRLPENEKIFRRYNILDYKDDWCGTILLDQFWVKLEGRVPTRDLNVPLEFIALSEAKQFGDGEYGAWSNYIPLTRKESSWDLYYVMLIETKADISQRVGLGKVFKEAFENSCRNEGRKEWKEFILG